MRASAAFTGTGLVSTNRSRHSGASHATSSEVRWASPPGRATRQSSETSAGARLATTPITPLPPSAMKPAIRASSPATRSMSQAARTSRARSSEPEASLSATARGARARIAATVAGFKSQPVRDGTL